MEEDLQAHPQQRPNDLSVVFFHLNWRKKFTKEKYIKDKPFLLCVHNEHARLTLVQKIIRSRQRQVKSPNGVVCHFYQPNLRLCE